MACLLVAMSALEASAATLSGRVVAVIDGDTIDVLDSQKRIHRIRLGAIDAPERAQAYGTRAKQALSDLAFGRQVEVEVRKIEQRSQESRHGPRKIGDVYAGGQDVGLQMVTQGMAWHYVRYQHEQSPSARSAYQRAENQARRKQVGLWADNKPTPPWEFRRR